MANSRARITIPGEPAHLGIELSTVPFSGEMLVAIRQGEAARPDCVVLSSEQARALRNALTEVLGA
ncbi:hypothetical protein BSL82_10015 [Tardibacter chloracetimidivorans]|uniref:Uncharacterized protein n=1 Tax=Tardibacter chloracetimidivorans TaxID=1921510 RepID=A0A1L3ZVF4_9SPHN|nr:hypothetical protein [Tardibacter chloracetimidivorans]API59608.1 hypothetical protein BSL82_10015 [Tardibacter chloracetimidivorans]